MTNYARMILVGGTVGVVVAGALAAPAVIAAVSETPQAAVVVSTIEEMFPVEAIDPKIFRRYDIVLGPGVSTEVQRSRTVRKIGYGYSSTVTVVTTPSGTYSTDGLLSPHVLYPGIEVTPKANPLDGGHWVSIERGSIIYFNFIAGPGLRT